MSERDTPATGPLSIDDVLDGMEPAPEADTPEPVEAEAAPDAVEEEAPVEAEAEDETTEADEPEAEASEDAQILTEDEYGDVLVRVSPDADPLPLRELLKGNLRQADYSRKTQEVAEQRKALEAELAEREKALSEREQAIAAQLAQFEDPEPDWVQMATDDPIGYVEARAKWEAKQATRQKAQAEAQAKAQQQRQQIIQKTAMKALEVFPEWQERGAFEKSAEARQQAAINAGFSPEEVAQAADYRIAVVLEKAARWDALQKSAPAVSKKVSKAPKVLKPGASSGTKAERDAAEKAALKKKLARPHTIDDRLKALGF